MTIMSLGTERGFGQQTGFRGGLGGPENHPAVAGKDRENQKARRKEEGTYRLNVHRCQSAESFPGMIEKTFLVYI